MVNRSTALCDGKIEYIEDLYKVIDGKQINDPEKLDFLRKKSQNKVKNLKVKKMKVKNLKVKKVFIRV